MQFPLFAIINFPAYKLLIIFGEQASKGSAIAIRSGPMGGLEPKVAEIYYEYINEEYFLKIYLDLYQYLKTLYEV